MRPAMKPPLSVPSGPTAPVRRARGRPPKLSPQSILDAALGLLAVGTIDELNLARVAEQLGASTMSLYTYFPNRDALLEALAAQAFSELELPPRGSQWRKNLLAWLWAVQRHFDQHPVVAKTMGWDGKVPAAWLRVSVPVIDELIGLGLRGEPLVFALNWFMSSATGLMLVEASAPAYRAPLSLGTLDTLSPHEQDTLIGLRRQWHTVDRERLLEYGFGHLLDGLAGLLPAQRNPKAPRRRG